tara:strand:- start:3824 stop:4054 length:231 start_codon:yes stop_codon:yes gene_type:complete
MAKTNENENISNSKNIKKKRCFHCNKKTLMLTQCKCMNFFCFQHRLPEVHSCCYDFKAQRDEKDFVDCNFKKIDKI